MSETAKAQVAALVKEAVKDKEFSAFLSGVAAGRNLESITKPDPAPAPKP